MYYFKILLNAKNVKGNVKNSFRAHKLLYYVVFDALCCSLFKQEMNVEDEDQLLPSDFQEKKHSGSRRVPRNAEQRQQRTCEGSSNQNKHYISF